jgi:hypothetical protein
MNAAQGLGLSLPGPILPPLKPVSQTDGPLSSGEGLIYSVRDAQENAKGEIEDPGVVDKRLLVLEGEFGAALRCMGRPGNTLSTTLRTAWDAANGWNVLAPITKSSRIAAINPHIGILGHITRAELISLLSSVDLYSGPANRLLWICVRRQKPVALPPPLDDQVVGELGRRVAERLKAAQEAAGVFRFTREAEQAWLALYDELTVDKPGAYGAATSQAEAQTVRLALIYALLDGAADINVQHIQAARAAWDYCDQSARYIFGDRESDPNADRLIEALRQGPMTKTKISGLFSNNLSARQLTELLEALQEAGRINLISKSTAGRPTTEIHLVS